MGEDMCDPETRTLFKKQRQLEFLNTSIGMIMLALLGWGSFQLFEQGKMDSVYHEKLDNHILEYANLATKIPDGFFSKERYGTSDADADRNFNRAQREILSQRITTLERLSATHISEAEIYKKMIQDTAESLRRLERIIWKIAPNEPDR